MNKFLLAISYIIILNSCDVLQQLPQIGSGSVTQDEAAQGIRQALSQ
jgi:hypothetical protein